jgi:membrane-bound lytic murein transglycosylase MltF
MTIKNRITYKKIRPLVDDDYDALAMMDAAYNCGLGCVQARRRLCAQVAGCDPDRWFGHVERHSAQSKVKWKGYGLSAHDITVQHARNVMVVRRPKYAALDA